MSKFKLSLMLFIISVVSAPALAGEAVVKRVPAGAVAFYFVFDLSYASGEFVRDWSNASTFSQGEPIAVFEESALLNTVASGTLGVFPGVFYNAFSSRLIDSDPILFIGQKIDFRKIVPDGVTITNFGDTIRSTDFFGASGGGTATAIGGNLRGESDN